MFVGHGVSGKQAFDSFDFRCHVLYRNQYTKTIQGFDEEARVFPLPLGSKWELDFNAKGFDGINELVAP